MTPSRIGWWLVPLGLLVLGLGCSDRKPARVQFTDAPAYITRRSPLTFQAAVVNKAGEPLAGRALAYSAKPAGIVEVAPGGSVRCLRSGDATLVVSGAGVTGEAPLRCRLPTEIAMPASVWLVIGDKPTVLKPQASDAGHPLPDAPVTLTSSDPSVAAIEGSAAKGVSVGKTAIRAAVGDIFAVTFAEAVQRVASGPVTLADGAKRSWTLEPGRYLVEIEFRPPPRVTQGVTVRWDGVSCEPQLEKPSHRIVCEVLESATLTVANPVLFGVGVSLTGSVAIYRIPPE
jgi:hypothetical protein